MKRITGPALLVAALLTGCGSLWRPFETPSPSVATELPQSLPPAEKRWLGTQFEDIPAPPEFTLDYDASYVSASARGPRVADLRYTGNTKLTDVLASTQQSMTRLGWQLNSLAGVAIKRLRYVKGDEECQLLIHEGEGGKSVLMVRLYPR